MSAATFKAKLAARQTASLVNPDHPSSSLVSFMCTLGVDAFMLDCEQGSPSFENIEDMTRAARLGGAASLVRIPSPEPWTIERYMMRGVDGLVVPRLDDAATAARVVDDIRYCAPRDFDRKTVIVQIESAQAVAGLDDLPETFSVIDIGGGSTEICMGSLSGVEKSVSMDIGSVRLTERFFSSLPPSEYEMEAAREEIDRVLRSSVLPFFASRESVYGVAGTLTTIAQVSQGLKHFDAMRVQNYRLSFAEVNRLFGQLGNNSLEEIIAQGIPEGRADVITMGALILRQFMRLMGIGEIRVSIQGLRFGLAQKELLRLQGTA